MAHNNHFWVEAPVVLMNYPKLALRKTEEAFFLEGDIELFSDGELVDIYKVEIHPTEYYPKLYPLVYEVGGKIPRNIDWHIYPDGHFCIGTPVEERLECSKGINLSTFISDKVISFLFSQTYRKKNGYFFRERSHGPKGILEFYKEYFNMPGYLEVMIALNIISSGKEPKNNSKCLCNSDRKYHKCHQRSIRLLAKITKHQVTIDLKNLNNYLKIS